MPYDAAECLRKGAQPVHNTVGNPTLAPPVRGAMSDDEKPISAYSTLDGDDVLRELRLQLEAVKARMEAHRETMEAAGLARPKRSDDEDARSEA